MNIVVVTNLEKAYGDFQAVKDISFAIREGEIFGRLGPNGAGKTSTINMMIGLSRPSSGSIFIGGIDAVRNTEKTQAIIGVVPDESNLYDDMDGFDNLCFCASLYGMGKEERESHAKALLKQFRLNETGNKPFKAYSKGMRRKLTIAAGIIHEPRILFLDEPTTGIDVESARQIRELLVDLKKKGTTIFITTHYIEDAERICDRIAFIVDGKIVALGTVAELIAGIAHGHKIEISADGILDECIMEMKKRFPKYHVILEENRIITLSAEKRIALWPVLQFFHSKGIVVYEAREVRSSLEDIFVKITGIEAAKLKKEKGGASK